MTNVSHQRCNTYHLIEEEEAQSTLFPLSLGNTERENIRKLTVHSGS